MSRQLCGSRSLLKYSTDPLFGPEMVVLLNCMKNQVGQQHLSSTMFLTQPGATGVDTVL